MKELKELRVYNDTLVLDDNDVKGSILPKVVSELDRDIVFKSDNIVEGAVYAKKINFMSSNVEIQGATYAELEVHVESDAEGQAVFKKSVGAVESVVSYARNFRIQIMGDVNSRTVKLYNAYVSGSIFADEIILENCVVIGGVFGTKSVEIRSSLVGTFNSPSVILGGTTYLLLPSAFSFTPIETTPGTRMYNLTLADLGSLYRKSEQMNNTGRILMDLTSDEVRSTLTDENQQVSVRCYSVAGKVLAADLLDSDKLQNHFLITAASLGHQLLRSYDLGSNEDGSKAVLTPSKIADFFFDIVNGKIEIQDISGEFSMESIKETFK